MVRRTLVLTSLCWFLGTATVGLAQSWPNQCSTGTCGASTHHDRRHSDGATYLQKAQAHWDLTKQQADLIAERNDAWPKPFQCFDRQAYHAVMVTMMQRGWQCECTLTSDHFDPTTNGLNAAGKAKINGIMNNLPEVTRQIHVFQDSDAAVVQTRTASIRDELQQKYSTLPAPELAVTTYVPHGMTGALIEDVQKKFVEGLPEPTVPRPKATTISNQ
jgi:hypothetical protein